MSPFRGVYTIKCTAGWITPSRGAWLQWGTCVEARVMLFEQLAQFRSACSNVHRTETVVPHRKKTQASPSFLQDRLHMDYHIESETLKLTLRNENSQKSMQIEQKTQHAKYMDICNSVNGSHLTSCTVSKCALWKILASLRELDEMINSYHCLYTKNGASQQPISLAKQLQKTRGSS